MTDWEKVIKGLNQHCEGSMFDRCGECPYYEFADKSFQCRDELLRDSLALLKEQEPREITKDEWESWKKTKYRDPLCMYWRGDVTPFWILRPEEVHEPAYLIGDIKIFNGKPTKEKMHEIWLNSCG